MYAFFVAISKGNPEGTERRGGCNKRGMCSTLRYCFYASLLHIANINNTKRVSGKERFCEWRNRGMVGGRIGMYRSSRYFIQILVYQNPPEIHSFFSNNCLL